MLMPRVQSYGITTQPKKITARLSNEMIISSMGIERAMAEVSISLNSVRIGAMNQVPAYTGSRPEVMEAVHPSA